MSCPGCFLPCLSGNKKLDLSKPNQKNAFQDLRNLSNGTMSPHKSLQPQIEASKTATATATAKTTTSQQMLPLNDTTTELAGSPSTDFRSMYHHSADFMSMRMNPKLRLLTSTSMRQSTIDDDPSGSYGEYEDDEEGDDNDDDNEWMNESSAMDEYQTLPPQVFDVGLMITIDQGHCQFHLVPDANYSQIHPNVYAPANLKNMRILYGGGSGVSVFGGYSPELGDIVMKHGGYQDLQDLFALATISEELRMRGERSGHARQAHDMQARLPCFRSIYISPHHIRSRGDELIGLLKGFVMNRNWSSASFISCDEKTMDSSNHINPQARRLAALIKERPSQMDLGMTIRIFEGEDDNSLSFVLNDSNAEQWKLSLVLPAGSTMFSNSSRVQVRGNPYDVLKSVVQGLGPIMTKRAFKFTLAQKTIGGSSPKTGNQWLYEGKLSGPVLKNLMDQMIQLIRDLELLTLPDEVDAVDEIRKEVLQFEESPDGLRANHISKMADSFVGNAIKKNFHPDKGRQHFLRQVCSMFRDRSLYLEPAEEIPAQHLGTLLRSGALMSDTFLNTPMEPTVLQMQPHFWRNILRRAVESRKSMSPHAVRRLWTCGLTDAGIHNLFLNETDLYLFDLGEPQLMSLPGFLTKFLFSFFHTLGMEDDGDGSWVRRFDVVGDKLALTKSTRDLLPSAYHAFETCLDRIIVELLDGDDSMRWLLLQYITMQLMSDTAFCLQKWQIKGGGKKISDNHQMNQEKWLWRALWDMYVAFDINTAESWCRFGVVHPHFEESFDPNMMEGFDQA